MFAFVIGLLLKIDSFSFIRLVCIVITIGGVLLISLREVLNESSSITSRGRLLGNFLSFISAFIYALYTCLLKKRVEMLQEKEKRFSSVMLFGFIGAINFIVFTPILFLLHFTHIERFEVPSSTIFLFLLVNGFIGSVISDVLWALSVLLTNSVVSLLGLSLTIPLAIIFDFVIERNPVYWDMTSLLYLLGTLFVCLSFVSANISYFLKDKIAEFDKGIVLFHKIKSVFITRKIVDQKS